MITYSVLKNLAAQNGLRVADLIALAPQNDPFYTGRPAEVQAAEWFAGLWRRFGYSQGVHLRRIHYQIVSNANIAKPNGERYENTLNDWKFLTEAGKWARYLGLVNPAAFVDRRNPDAIVRAAFSNPGDWDYDDPTPRYSVADRVYWGDFAVPELPGLPELPDLPDEPDFVVRGYRVQQPYLVEVWAEKTTMNDILEPLCRRYRCNLVTGAGELSITAVLEFLKRARRAGRPARILYVSDFDPAGLGMPISVARKIEFFLRNEGDDLDVKLEPVVLLSGQIERYNLPRVPVKDTDLRKANFERDHGEGQVELDALEALYPGELATIVTEAITQYYDPTLEDRARDAERQLTKELSAQRDKVLAQFESAFRDLKERHQDTLDHWETTREKFQELVSQFQVEVDAYNAELAEIVDEGSTMYAQLASELEQLDVDIDDVAPLPDPDLAADPGDQLYSSDRDYGEQLSYYKAYRHGNGNESLD